MAGTTSDGAGFVRRTLTLGTGDRDALRAELAARGVGTNAYFDVVWPAVDVASAPRPLDVVVATAAALGLPDGATLDALVAHVAALGLAPCPLEAAARLCLALDEPAGSGRITVVSARAFPDPERPRGLYVRLDAEGLWLRGYVASDDWCFDATERFALAVGSGSDARPSGSAW